MRNAAAGTIAVVLLATTALMLGGGLLVKRQCVYGIWQDRFQYTNLCYNDLQALYYTRALDERKVPYVEEFNEYPTLVGTEMWLTASVSRSDRSFFWWNAVVLSLCAFMATAALVATGSRWNGLLFAGAPALFLYTAHNWDLLAVAPLAAGLWKWREERYVAAGLFFGLGAAAKLFPLAALVTGVVALTRQGRRRRDIAGFAGALVLTVLAWNLPYALANGGLWLETWTFHGKRFPDFGTVWYWVWQAAGEPSFDGFKRVADVGGLGVMASVTVLAVVLQWRRRVPLPAATGIIVAAFLVVTKVHSPQYALWMLPFLVLVRGSWPYWLAYSIADAVLFVAGFRWIASWDENFNPVANGWRVTFALAVFARAGALIAMAVHFARCPEPDGVAESPRLSPPLRAPSRSSPAVAVTSPA